MRIIEILDSPIAFHRCLAEITGSANAGLLLSQAIYWQNRPRREDPSGWWYKTREDWYKETSLSRKELETARRACSGILLYKVKVIPPKTYYKVNVEELEKRLLALPSRSGQIIRTETGRMNGPNWAVCSDRNGPSISTETNTETKLISPKKMDSKEAWIISKKLEAKKGIMEELKRNHTIEVATGTVWQNESARKEYLVHRKEVKDLANQMASV